MWDLVSLRNVKSEEQARVSSGRVVHARAAATGKAQSPRVARRVDGTCSVVVSAERRHRHLTVMYVWPVHCCGRCESLWCYSLEMLTMYAHICFRPIISSMQYCSTSYMVYCRYVMFVHFCSAWWSGCQGKWAWQASRRLLYKHNYTDEKYIKHSISF